MPMNRSFRHLVMCVICLIASGGIARSQSIELIRQVAVPGDTRDLSGRGETLSDGTPGDLLGGPSGLTWTGKDQVYLWLSDRGPKDGATTQVPRFHQVDLGPSIASGASPVIQRTILLKNAEGKPFSGSSSAFDARKPENSLRFDSEGIAVHEGKVFVSEEYGPRIVRFDPTGKAEMDWPVPSRFATARPTADEAQDLADNATGRLPNAGFEGLCTDGDGGLLAALQRPLRQDGAYAVDGRRVGRNVRLLRMCGPNCKPREYVYVLHDAMQGISELCHVGGTRFLAIERDGFPGAEAKFKKITLFDIADATDVSNEHKLPEGELPSTIVPVRKTVLMDLLDPVFGLAGASFPEKIEGLAFGPNLADGRRLLVVGSDNDFEPAEPIRLWFFAVPVEALRFD